MKTLHKKMEDQYSGVNLRKRNLYWSLSWKWFAFEAHRDAISNPIWGAVTAKLEWRQIDA